MLINYACLLATTSNDDVRDGARAKEIAVAGCELTSYQDADLVEDLAAAHAELREFEEAVKWQEKAVALFENENLALQAPERLEMYKTNKPFRR